MDVGDCEGQPRQIHGERRLSHGHSSASNRFVALGADVFPIHNLPSALRHGFVALEECARADLATKVLSIDQIQEALSTAGRIDAVPDRSGADSQCECRPSRLIIFSARILPVAQRNAAAGNCYTDACGALSVKSAIYLLIGSYLCGSHLWFLGRSRESFHRGLL